MILASSLLRRTAGIVFAAALSILILGKPAVAQYASIIVESGNGRILYARNPDKPVHPASLTKMMTLYLVFEALNQKRLSPDSRLAVSKQASRQPASRLGLKAGNTLSLEQAILALVTKSANDVATVVGENLGNGSERIFAQMMTRKARSLGMRRTTFRNASGIHDPLQISTARDMSILARALLRDFPQYYSYFSTPKFRYGDRTHSNHNKLLKSYDGVDGIKTGYIRASGYNLAASAKRGGNRLIGVVMGGKTSQARNRHMADLLDKSFAKLRPRNQRFTKVAGKPSQLTMQAPETRPSPRDIPALDPPNNPQTWSVQVGAFKQYGPAFRLAQKAVDKLSQGTGRHRIHIVRSGQSSKINLYRARLIGYDKSQAKRICRKLKALGMDCLAIAPAKRQKIALAAP